MNHAEAGGATDGRHGGALSRAGIAVCVGDDHLHAAARIQHGLVRDQERPAPEQRASGQAHVRLPILLWIAPDTSGLFGRPLRRATRAYRPGAGVVIVDRRGGLDRLPAGLVAAIRGPIPRALPFRRVSGRGLSGDVAHRGRLDARDKARFGHGNALDVQPHRRSDRSACFLWDARLLRRLENAVLGDGWAGTRLVLYLLALVSEPARRDAAGQQGGVGAHRRGPDWDRRHHPAERNRFPGAKWCDRKTSGPCA